MVKSALTFFLRPPDQPFSLIPLSAPVERESFWGNTGVSSIYSEEKTRTPFYAPDRKNERDFEPAKLRGLSHESEVSLVRFRP